MSLQGSLAARNSAGTLGFARKPAERWGNEAFYANNLYN